LNVSGSVTADSIYAIFQEGATPVVALLGVRLLMLWLSTYSMKIGIIADLEEQFALR